MQIYQEFVEQMEQVIGIDEYDLTNLRYFGVVGTTSCVGNSMATAFYVHSNGKSTYTITSTTPFANLSSVTKQAVKQLFLQNNNITSLNGIVGFTKLYLLRCEYNLLTSLDGLENMSELVYLEAAYNVLGRTGEEGTYAAEASVANAYAIYKADGTISGGTALKALADKTSLVYLCLQNNSYLANSSWLLGCKLLDTETNKYTYMSQIDLSGCSKTMVVSGFESEGFVSGMGANLKLPVAIYTSDVFDITIQDLNYDGNTYKAAGVTDTILLGSPLYGNTHITKLNLTGCTQVTNEAWMILLESMPNLEYVKLQNCTKLTGLEWISRADYRESKAWFSNYSVDVNGTAVSVSLGPTFTVGTVNGDDNLSVNGYYYAYTGQTDKSNPSLAYSSVTGRNYSTAANQVIGTYYDAAGRVASTKKSIGPGEAEFKAYTFEAYQYTKDATTGRNKTYQYMVNEYDYSYDNNISYTSTWGTTYSGLSSCSKLIELDIRGTSVRDYTPVNGLITSAKGASHKLDLAEQRTLDGDLGTEALSTSTKTSGSNGSTLSTFRVSDGADLKNIVPTLNRLNTVCWWSGYPNNTTMFSGLFFSDNDTLKGVEDLRNYQYFVNYQYNSRVRICFVLSRLDKHECNSISCWWHSWQSRISFNFVIILMQRQRTSFFG